MKRVLMGALVAACVCCAGSIAAEDAKAAAKPEAKTAAKAPAKKAAAPAWQVWAAPDVKFSDVEGMKGAQVAPLWGDMKKGAYGAYFKWEPGFSAGWHTHSHPVRVVVAQGTFTLELEGQAEKELGPGSYTYDPGNSKHKSGCKAGGSPCVFLVAQNAPFDFHPVEEKK
jgi:quercetin dioxygenase-like cupin family protein